MNKKFEVNFEKVFHLVIEVEAENKDEAEQKAHAKMEAQTKRDLVKKCQEGYFEHTYTDEVEVDE
jgi:hypothetical protein